MISHTTRKPIIPICRSYPYNSFLRPWPPPGLGLLSDLASSRPWLPLGPFPLTALPPSRPCPPHDPGPTHDPALPLRPWPLITSQYSKAASMLDSQLCIQIMASFPSLPLQACNHILAIASLPLQACHCKHAITSFAIASTPLQASPIVLSPLLALHPSRPCAHVPMCHGTSGPTR